MKVGFYSPLPPAPTGVADYAAALLAALKKQGVVEVEAADAEIALYHIGNNHLHREIYRRALAHPGVVALHDAVLQHFFLGMLDQTAYEEEFVYNYGGWTRSLAGDLWKNRARSAADPRYFEYSMLKRLVETSLAVIVHNPAAARIVDRHAPRGPVVEIPHLFLPPKLPDAAATLRFRAELGVSPMTLLVGVFGHLRESKRLPVVLRAMERLWQEGADATLLVQGAFASTDLERSLAPHIENHARILRTGYLPEDELLAMGRRHGRVYQSAFPDRRGNFRHRGRDDGYRQGGGVQLRRGDRAHPEERLPACGFRPGGRGDADRLPPLVRRES